MKKLFNRFIRFIENKIVSIQINKTRFTERYALFRKRSLYSDIKWSKERIQDFYSFWKKNYGSKINPNGHKLYESINGVYNKDYIPDYLYATKIEPMLNSYFYAKLYSDKSLTEIIYSNFPDVKLPKTYLVNSNGVFYVSSNSNRLAVSVNKVLEKLKGDFEAVIKPTIGGSSGFGVMICNFIDGYDEKKKFHIKDLINSKQMNYIVQEKIYQHESINKLYPNSVNTIRAITYILEGEVYCADMSLRIGTGGKSVDNIHSGGLVIGMDNNGILLKYAYKLGYTDSKEKYLKHPDTGVLFENYKIEGAGNIPEIAKELHCLTPNIGIISWDFSINDKAELIIIEANYWGQSVWIPQIVHGKPIFGEQTPRMLNKLRGKKK